MSCARGVVAGTLVAAVIVACGGAQKVDTGYDKRDEILTLWTQIRDWRMRAKLPVDPSPGSMHQFAPRPLPDAKNVCPEDLVAPKTCDDVCSLGEAICDNAERICKLADELGKDDRFAQEKCASAKASCGEAKERCCICAKDAEAEAQP